MKIVTWNLNSVRARKDHLLAYLERQTPDIVCLQELKGPDDIFPLEEVRALGYEAAIHGQPTYNGVAILSRRGLSDVHTGLPGGDDGQARLIAATIQGIRIVNLYCPQGQDVDSPKFAYKLSFYEHLSEWLRASIDPESPWVVAGDLNIAPQEDDVWSVDEMRDQVSFHPLEHAAFAAVLELGLIDAVKPHIPPSTFTFWDYRQNSFRRKRGMRIDHILVTHSVLDRTQRAWVDVDERSREKPSDHAPVGIEVDI